MFSRLNSIHLPDFLVLSVTPAFVTDQIGRTYFSTEGEMKKSLEQWADRTSRS
jgi:hypothetical protein